MIGLVIATHSKLARELIAAAEMVIGPLENARSVCIERDDSLEKIRAALAGAIEEVDHSRGVAIMTDMFGGTPSNVSLSFLDPGRLEVLTGVNLPMVIKFFNTREELDLTELVDLLKSYGQQSISLASQYLQK